ncbi:MAG: HEAT repeat domain-containing protein [Prochlorococcus sp.]|nr:HEAT repeat domain-containing protein [Prochlorococcaceae cyanobacterium Fu_MAG_50]
MTDGFVQPAAKEGAPINEAEAIARLRQTVNPSDQYYAAWWLGRMRSRHPDTIPLLRDRLGRYRCDPTSGDVDANAVALNSARALGRIKAEASIPDLIHAVAIGGYHLREVAAQSLGDLKAEAAVPALCQQLRLDSELFNKESALNQQKLGRILEALLEALGAIGDQSEAVVAVIQPFAQHERPLVSSAACRALLQLTQEPRWAEPIEALLGHTSVLIRRGALLDLGAAGWMPSLPAIQATQAENSLKLIALKGLAEQARRDQANEKSITAVLAAMDALL